MNVRHCELCGYLSAVGDRRLCECAGDAALLLAQLHAAPELTIPAPPRPAELTVGRAA